MLIGAHFLLYSTDAEADRAFFKDVLQFPSVDAGGGWLIFALPPSELAVHPADATSGEMYLMCNDLPAYVQALAGRGVRCGSIEQAPWGARTTVTLPSGAEIGLYEPRHPLAVGLS